ncbi:N-acetyltransferase 9 [Coemansia sp. RSA 1933]|nr:N-acetyltransferase 9 [Coemansia sp. RSA 1933]
MRANEHLAIVSDNVVLVPYEKFHVPKYHDWMKSPYLQEMTGSEPLTIDEEYSMQLSWRNDDDKCTFIILANTPAAQIDPHQQPCAIYSSDSMIGDVNFYLNNHDNPHEAELEVMIAEQAYSGQGIATDVLKLMMHYAVNDIGVTNFVVRIKESNAASIYIFQSKFGFVEIERSSVFKEVTLRRDVSDDLKNELCAWAEQHSKRIAF